MDFQTALASVKRPIDIKLEKFFAAKREEAQRISLHCVTLVDQVAAITLRGGKRTRAFLVWLGFQATHPYSSSESRRNVGKSREVTNKVFSTSPNNIVVSAMLAIELFQSFALIHDDIIDGDTIRRGGPTVHVTLGVSLAILAGDLALAWADELMEKVRSQESKVKSEDIYQCMKQEVILGQSLDVLAMEGKPSADRATINRYKTAWYSVIRPLQLGATIGGADDEGIASFVPYGLVVGEAYQLRDDILDGAVDQHAFLKKADILEKQAFQAVEKLKYPKSVTILLTDFARFALHRPA